MFLQDKESSIGMLAHCTDPPDTGCMFVVQSKQENVRKYLEDTDDTQENLLTTSTPPQDTGDTSWKSLPLAHC